MKDENGVRIRYLNKTVPTGIIYTMNCPEWLLEKLNYPTILGSNERAMRRLFGHCEALYSCDTYQYTDYDKYDCNLFDKNKKAVQREKQFPIDVQNAYDMGKRLTEMVVQNCEKK